MGFPLCPQRSLNFWQEIRRRGIPTFAEHKNQRFAHEMILQHFFPFDAATYDFKVTENSFRRFGGVGCRTLNGFSRLHQGTNEISISLSTKPFEHTGMTLTLMDEFLVVRAHGFSWDNLQPPADYNSTDLSTNAVKEAGCIERTLVRRYMLPANWYCIRWKTENNQTDITIYLRTPRREIDIPIQVED